LANKRAYRADCARLECLRVVTLREPAEVLERSGPSGTDGARAGLVRLIARPERTDISPEFKRR